TGFEAEVEATMGSTSYCYSTNCGDDDNHCCGDIKDEFWNGRFVLPKAKRTNIGNDADLMALLDSIDNIDYIEKNNIDGGVVIKELGIEEERFSVVIKSLEDEIGFKPNDNENVDATKKEQEIVEDKGNNNSSLVDRIYEATTSGWNELELPL
ncbi:hypothetical protein KI387_012916, partial [Taxus chinensis]